MMDQHYQQVYPNRIIVRCLYIADVGIAMGSGSDIAIGSAKFILMSSTLVSIITLLDLSRTVIRRIKFNFLWCSRHIID